MTSHHRLLLVLFSALVATSTAACSDDTPPGGAADAPAPDDTEGWVESVDESSPWPWFGTEAPVPPAWQAPEEFGCKVRQRVRREPDQQITPGSAPRKVVVEELPTVCLDAGVMFDVTDDAKEPIVTGDCASGYRLATKTKTIAAIEFGSPLDCETYAFDRADALVPVGARTVARLRLVSREPAVVAFVEIRAPHVLHTRNGSKTVE